MIIDLIYQLYFDRLHNEHFGTIKQQIYSALHFPLHIVLVPVLQGASLLIIWLVALRGLEETDNRFRAIKVTKAQGLFASGSEYVVALRRTIDLYIWHFIPKGTDVSKNSSSGTRACPALKDCMMLSSWNPGTTPPRSS